MLWLEETGEPESISPCPWSPHWGGPGLRGQWLLATGMGSGAQECSLRVSWLRRCALAGKLGLRGPVGLGTHRPPPCIGVLLLLWWGFWGCFSFFAWSDWRSLPSSILPRGPCRLPGCLSTGRPCTSLFALGEETPPAPSRAAGTRRGRPLPPQNHLQIASVCSDKHWKKYLIFFFSRSSVFIALCALAQASPERC